MLATARAQVAAYPTVTFVQGEAVSASVEPEGFAVTLATGEVLDSTRLVLAFGISDELPAIPGLAERWGKSVLHCPYCHGFEFSGQRLGVLSISPMSIHQAMLIAEWGPTTFYLNGAPEPDDDTLAQLQKRGVTIEPAPVRALHGDRHPAAPRSSSPTAGCRTLDALYLGPPHPFEQRHRATARL